jgi:hypothetical protein
MNNIEELIVPANVPAQVLEIPNSNFNLTYKNDLVTHVKLRVFYQGLTKDRRLFTEEFSNRLLGSLPQTPVVGYWDTEKEDFVGHNHTQFIYGYVPENAKFGFETDPDGSKWAVTELVLFTGRGDNIGKVAQKIIGKKHSLELDSGSMKYSVKRNPDGQMQHIELQEAKFVGLSVLGDNQTPAFEGSAFFTDKGIKTCELGKCVEEVKEKYSVFLSKTDNKIGGEDVKKEETKKQVPAEIISELQNFMRVTEDEMAKGIMEAAYGKFGQNIFVVQWSSVDDMIVFMDMADGMYYRSKFYMTGDDKIEMGDKMWVKPRFLTEEEINMVFPETPEERAQLDAEIQKNQEEMQQDMAQATAAKTDKVEVKEVKPEANVEVKTEVKPEVIAQATAAEVKAPEAAKEEVKPVVTPAPELVAKAEVAAPVVETEKPAEPIVETKVPEAEVKANDEKKQEGFFITESERVKIEADRKELAAFRKEKKLGVIEKYSEYLNKDEKSLFSSKVDEFTLENLEAELAKIAMQKVLKQNQNTNVAGTYGIRTAPKLQQTLNSDGLAKLVERYKGK